MGLIGIIRTMRDGRCHTIGTFSGFTFKGTAGDGIQNTVSIDLSTVYDRKSKTVIENNRLQKEIASNNKRFSFLESSDGGYDVFQYTFYRLKKTDTDGNALFELRETQVHYSQTGTDTSYEAGY